jgi:hypothetical protein
MVPAVEDDMTDDGVGEVDDGEGDRPGGGPPSVGGRVVERATVGGHEVCGLVVRCEGGTAPWFVGGLPVTVVPNGADLGQDRQPPWHVLRFGRVGEVTPGLDPDEVVVYCDDTGMIESWPPPWAEPGARVRVVEVPDPFAGSSLAFRDPRPAPELREVDP